MAQTGVGGILEGARIHRDGWRLLRRERRLWPLALVPLLVSMLFVSATFAVVVAYAAPLHALVTGWMPTPEATSAWQWLWVGPARAGLWLLGGLLFLAAAGAAAVAAFLLASIVAAPFLDALSRRVEATLTGRVEETEVAGLGAILRDGGRALVEEAKRTSTFLALQAGIAFAGIVVPGGQLVAPAAAALLTILFLPLDHASYALDRRRVRFREKRRWIRERSALLMGYGGVAFVMCLVPGLNFLAMPVLVASGTVLALRYGPKAAPDTAAAQASRAR